jgi:excisionase family DNA binding protein
MDPSTHEEVLTLEEAAERLKIAPKTMRDWLRTGRMPGFKAGKLWRVRASDIDAVIASRLQLSRPQPVRVSDEDEG